VLDIAFLVVYIALVAVVLWASKSLATGLVHLLFGTALTGSALALWGIPGWTWTYRSLQAWLVLGLAATAAYAWHTTRDQRPAWPRRRTLITLAPPAAIALALLATRLLATDAGGPLAGVGYLINHPIAEDNAKWLMASAQLAHGGQIFPDYLVGRPLLMLMVVAATAISVASTLLYGGVNQVAVAADTLILTQHALAIAAPLALAPIAAATWTLRRRARQRATPTTAGRTGPRAQQIPALALWTGMGILAATSILLTRYGHLTLQYTLIVLALWATCFLAPATTPRTRLLATLTVAACSQVWFPLNILATFLLIATLAWTTTNAITAHRSFIRDRTRSRRARAAGAWGGVAFTAFLFGTMFSYLRSSIDFTVGVPITGSSSAAVAAPGGPAATVLPLFSISGGTEVVTPMLLLLAVAGLVGAASLSSAARQAAVARRPGVRAVIEQSKGFLPLVVLMAYAGAVAIGDFWAMGTGPGYGNRKIVFAVTTVVMAATIPLAITRLDLGRRGTTPTRLAAVVLVGFLLVADTLVPRALAEIRPQAWPAESPLNMWSPAEVRPTADQPLDTNPIGCVYVTSKFPAPSALPKGQVAYSCTRLLTSLGGVEPSTGPLREWLQREWGSNTSLWNDYYLRLQQVPVTRPFIVLDENASPLRTATLQELLSQYPPTALPK